MVLLWIIIPLFILYSILIIYYWQTWKAIPEYKAVPGPGETKISVIIPARNEEKNIGTLLSSLEVQQYPQPLTQVIVINDHSEDRTQQIVRQHNVQLLELNSDVQNSYKKKAIETGIAAAQGDLIITTDADCQSANTWLNTIASFQQETKAVFIAAPVDIACGSRMVEMFQSLDFMILQGITGAVVHKKYMTMCNGANLAYEKKVFAEVNGFSGVDHIASGDDMLLMYKIWQKYPDKVLYLKSRDAIVSTQPVKTWSEFFNQRIRWASKARQYEDKRILPVLVLVYLFNLSFLVLLIAGFWDFRYWIAIAALWLAKTAVELPFIISLAGFFRKEWTVKWFFFFQPLHIAYTIIAGFLGQLGKYSWKGRRVK
jgi:biofilm PGA synthesis N-glycosyltransferase PgaC